MNHALRLSKKVFTWGVVATTIAWSVGVASMPLAASAATFATGTLIKGSLSAVYYYASNGKRYVFPDAKTYFTWYPDFSTVVKVTDADLATIPLGGNNVTYRAGTRLSKILSVPTVYAVEPGGKLRGVTSETIATSLWGGTWNQRVNDIPDSFFTNYTSGNDITSAMYPTGSLVKTASSPDIWYIDGTSKRKVTAAGMAANWFRNEFVVTTSVDLAGLTVGTDISTNEPALTDVAQLGTPGVPTGPVASGVTISAASDSPVGMTIVSGNSASSGGQSLIPALKVHFAASSDGAVQVNSIKLSRGGISSDSDLQDVYLYDGSGFDKMIARTGSISNGKVNFTNAGGLFTIPAGGSKDVMVRFDIVANTSAGKTISFSLAAADVVPATSATAVSGSAMGGTFTTALVSDLGKLELKNINPTAAGTVDPQNNYEVWRFQMKGSNQNLLVKSLIVTNAGSVSPGDIQNYKLFDGATQLGATVATVSGNTIWFDFSGMADGGYKITSGQTKQLSLRADIVGGTNRTYRYSIRNSTDVAVWDMGYNVYIRPLKDGTSGFSVIEPNDGGTPPVAVDITISTGKLTVSKASDSPSTNVSVGGTNILLGKWTLTAAGEDVKISTVSAKCNSGDGTTNLKNTKLLLDGSQIGTTITAATLCNNTATFDYTFGNSAIIKAGGTQVLALYADLTDATVTTGDTITASLVAGSSNAEGRISLTSISTSASTANTVTVKGGALVASLDASFTNRTSSNPTGVLGGQMATIGQFIVTGGGEDADVTQIVLGDVSGDGVKLSDYFQNLRLWNDAGVQVGTTFGTLTATDGTTFTFTPSTPIRVPAGGTKVFKISADILTSAGVLATINALAVGPISVTKVSATGVSTGTDDSDSDGTNGGLQKVFLGTNANLSVYVDSATPIASTYVLGSTANELARFKFEANQNEDINITRLVISDIMTGQGGVTDATGTLKNLKLVDANTGIQYGGTIAALDTSNTTGSTIAPVAIFDNISNLSVMKSNSVSIKVIADLTSFVDGGVSSSTHKLAIVPSFVGFAGGDASSTPNSSLSITATGKDSGFSISGTWLDFNGSSVNSNTDLIVSGNTAYAYRAKITIAKSATAPSGLSGASSEQTVAKFVVTNVANIGNYSATLKLMNPTIGSTISNTTARAIKIYKDSVAPGNLLASTTACVASVTACAGQTSFTDTAFTDLDISAGASKELIVTIDTTDATTQKNLTVSLDLGSIRWSDGVTGTAVNTGIHIVDSLPVQGNTLTY